MDKRIDEFINIPKTGWMKECINEWVNYQMNGSVDALLVFEYTNELRAR